MLCKACSKNQICYSDFIDIFYILSFVHFHVDSSSGDAPFLTFLPLLECFLEPTVCDGAGKFYRIFLNLLYGLETGKSLLGVRPEIMVVGVQRMSDVFPDNYGRGATREPAHCRGATSTSGVPTIQTFSCTQHSSEALKVSGVTVSYHPTTWCKSNDGQCLSNLKTQ